MSALTALYSLFFLAFTFYLDRSLTRLYYLHEGDSRKESRREPLHRRPCHFHLRASRDIALEPSDRQHLSRNFQHRDSVGTERPFTSLCVSSISREQLHRGGKADSLPVAQFGRFSHGAGDVLVCDCAAGRIDGWLKALMVSNGIVALPAAVSVAEICTLRVRWHFIREALYRDLLSPPSCSRGCLVPWINSSWPLGRHERQRPVRSSYPASNIYK